MLGFLGASPPSRGQEQLSTYLPSKDFYLSPVAHEEMGGTHSSG